MDDFPVVPGREPFALISGIAFLLTLSIGLRYKFQFHRLGNLGAVAQPSLTKGVPPEHAVSGGFFVWGP